MFKEVEIVDIEKGILLLVPSIDKKGSRQQRISEGSEQIKEFCKIARLQQ